jgi:hypothetical protein
MQTNRLLEGSSEVSYRSAQMLMERGIHSQNGNVIILICLFSKQESSSLVVLRVEIIQRLQFRIFISRLVVFCALQFIDRAYNSHSTSK